MYRIGYIVNMGTKKELDLIDQQVAELLAAAIANAGITYRELREITGMSINRIGIILRQESPPATIGEIDSLARAVGMSAGQLLALTDPVSPAEFMLAARESDDDLEVEAQQEEA